MSEFPKPLATGEYFTPQGSPVVPTITLTLAEFTLLNRRIGYLEGVWEAVSVDDVPGGVVDQVNARYKEICGGGKS